MNKQDTPVVNRAVYIPLYAHSFPPSLPRPLGSHGPSHPARRPLPGSSHFAADRRTLAPRSGSGPFEKTPPRRPQPRTCLLSGPHFLVLDLADPPVQYFLRGSP